MRERDQEAEEAEAKAEAAEVEAKAKAAEAEMVAWWDVVRSRGATECADGAPGQ